LYFLEATESYYRFGLSKLHLHIYLSIYPSLERLACPTGGKELCKVKGSRLSKLILGGVGFEWVQTRVAGPLHQPFHCFRVYTSASAIIIAFSQARAFWDTALQKAAKSYLS